MTDQTPHEALTAAVAQLVMDNAGPICQHDPELWTSEDAHERADAAARCRPCPILTLCAEVAESTAEPWGVWGGVDRDAKAKALKAAAQRERQARKREARRTA